MRCTRLAQASGVPPGNPSEARRGRAEPLVSGHAAQVIEGLQQAGGVVEQIDADCRRWLDIVRASPLNNEEALTLLLATLETLLEEKDDDNAEQT